MPLEGVYHIYGGDGLPRGVLGVGDGVADDVLEEDLQDAPGLLVDEAGDPLYAAPPGQAPDGGLRDALQYKRYGPSIRRFSGKLITFNRHNQVDDHLDVVVENLTMPLGTPLAQPLASAAHPV